MMEGDKAWNVIVFDLDGTLCNVQHRLHHVNGKKKDYDAFHSLCGADKPVRAVMIILKSVLRDGMFRVFFITGRTEKYRKETQVWFKNKGVDSHQYRLLMRPDDDFRPAAELKESLVKEHIGAFNQILFAIEDNEKVCQMWERNRVQVLRVTSEAQGV